MKILGLVVLSVLFQSLTAAGAQSEQNRESAAKAIVGFQNVLRLEPNNIDAIRGLAQIYQNANEPRKARPYHLRHAELMPKDQVAFGAVGAVDWIIVSDKRSPASAEEKATLIEEGLRHLDTALILDPEYSEAMAYKNLLLREKSLLSRDEVERIRLVSEADDWFRRALDTRKRNQQTRGFTANPPQTMPPPQPLPPASTPRLRLGQTQVEANLISRPALSYPKLAETARIQGTVLIQAIINKEGIVGFLQGMSGHPLLVDAALENVRGWRFKPFLLNGEPTEVLTTISLPFRLQ